MKDLNLLSLSNGSSKNIKIGELSSDVINTLGLNLNHYIRTNKIKPIKKE